MLFRSAANPAPPVGPALGAQGVNIMGFCKEFNARTENVEKGTPLPTVITVYQDKSFTFVTKTPPTPNLLRAAAGVPKGAKNTGVEKVGRISKAQLEDIARTKLPDLNTKDLDAAMLQVAGTARSMGITIDD